MPRQARKLSSTNIYHVVIKGLNQQIIFEDKKDYIKYLDTLEFYSAECHIKLLAYCLMSNHVHLVLCTSDYPLDRFFRKLNTHYAIWFNMKYQRSGHLQQDRFYSEPIEDEQYLLSAIRYVHLNPFHAGCEAEPGTTYPWNSFHEYINNSPKLIDIDYISKYISIEDFINFHHSENNISHIDISNLQKRLPDDVAKDIIFTITSCLNSTDFQKLSTLDRNTYVCRLHEEGLSIRQLNRLTGIPKGIIERAIAARHRDAP